MDVREKLVELLKPVCSRSNVWNTTGDIAEYLIAHGVTVQEWVSAKDRLPGTEKVLITNGDLVLRGYRRPDGVWKHSTEPNAVWENISSWPVTHWMPLPEPPKEES